jgi:hypothetical protein
MCRLYATNNPTAGSAPRANRKKARRSVFKMNPAMTRAITAAVGRQTKPVTGAPNSARFPAFFHLDLHLGHEEQMAGTIVSLSLDVNNVTAHHNGESFVYNYDYTRLKTLDAPLRTLYFVGRWQS